jgi:hypothetical protein
MLQSYLAIKAREFLSTTGDYHTPILTRIKSVFVRKSEQSCFTSFRVAIKEVRYLGD